MKIKSLSWKEFLDKNYQDRNSILFKERVLKRKRIYHFIFNFMQFLNLFDEKNFRKCLFKNFPKNYLTIHARYSVKGGIYSKNISTIRNMHKDDLKKILNELTIKYKKCKIIVLTDTGGFKYYQSLKKHFSNLKFSKEISKSFLGDAKLLLNSKKFFQYHGGGMGMIATFSNVPYLFCWKSYDFINNEFFWIKDKKYTSWQNNFQQTYICPTLDDYLNYIR